VLVAAGLPYLPAHFLERATRSPLPSITRCCLFWERGSEREKNCDYHPVLLFSAYAFITFFACTYCLMPTTTLLPYSADYLLAYSGNGGAVDDDAGCCNPAIGKPADTLF